MYQLKIFQIVPFLSPLPLSTLSRQSTIEENRDFHFSIEMARGRGRSNAPPPRLRSLIIPAAGEGCHGSTYSTGQVTIEQLYFSSVRDVYPTSSRNPLPLHPHIYVITKKIKWESRTNKPTPELHRRLKTSNRVDLLLQGSPH